MNQKSTDEANIELNNRFDSSTGVPQTNKKTLTTEEANTSLQERFSGDHDPEDISPTYLSNNTPAIKISGEKDEV